jgi:virginiamycin B lyase
MKEAIMKYFGKSMMAAMVVACFASITAAATVTGTVKGPDGAPCKGAFVQAQSTDLNMMMSVLSDKEGHYKLENLPASTYRIQIHVVGYKADPQANVKLTKDQKTSFDFALQPAPIHWTDISTDQAEAILPDGPNRDVIFRRCFEGCHSFQHKFAPYRLSEDEWRDKVKYMKWAQYFFVGDRMDTQFAQAVQYLGAVFSPDSTLPDSPADLPGYKATVRPLSDDALNIVYVEYNTLPGNPPLTHTRSPWSAWYDEPHNQVIVPYIHGNGFGRMDLKTGKVEEYFLNPPADYTAKSGGVGFHSIVPAKDGTLWFTEQGRNILGKWDPTTKEFTEYTDTVGKHTARIDSKGIVWTSGALSKFDPETKKFTHFPDVPSTYQMYIDKNDDAWFTEMKANGGVGKVDAKTGEVVKYPYHDFYPHRLTIDPHGMAWFNGRSDKIVRLDPATGKFTDFPIPGPNVGTYAIGYDLDGGIWYNSQWVEYIGRLDSKTGNVIQYPFPQTENGMKELLPDRHNRVWFGSPYNDKFGYFYLAGKTDRPIN